LGDDGVPLDYHLKYWKSELIDFVILQQDAFDKIDASSSLARQHFMLEKVLEICNMEFKFDSFEQVNPYFKRVINSLKQMNYSTFESEPFKNNEKELETIIQERKIA
jgi:V/A-type H+/Na+-transporting ATPase subunit A